MKRHRFPVGFGALIAAVSVVVATLPSPAQADKHHRADPQGIFKLDHLIFIVQENRSFDHYFGTFPGANGFPVDRSGALTTCIPNPFLDHCSRPYHTSSLYQWGAPHGNAQAIVDVAGGRMNGFMRSLPVGPDKCWITPTRKRCASYVGPQLQPDVMSYVTRREIPNYWTYAKHFVLQDRMFESTESWTLPSHLFILSG